MLSQITEKANNLMMSYYAHSPPPYNRKQNNQLLFAPYQMMLNMVAPPELLVTDPDREMNRMTYQLFCTSTGSGKTITILNIAWQYATSSVMPFDVYIVAPPKARAEIIKQLTSEEKVIPIPGMNLFVAHIRKKYGKKDPKEYPLFVQNEMDKRNIHFITYVQLCNACKKKNPSGRYPNLRDMGPNVVLVLDEAHALTDASAAGDPMVTDDTLAAVRQKIYDKRIGGMFAFTWTLTTVSVLHAICLMVAMRGRTWSEKNNLTPEDWPIKLKEKFQSNRFFVLNSSRQGVIKDTLKEINSLPCPIKVSSLPKVALSINGQEGRDLTYNLFRGHVFYLDVSGDIRAAMETFPDPLPVGKKTRPPLTVAPTPTISNMFISKDPYYISFLLRRYGYKGTLPPNKNARGLEMFKKWYNTLDTTAALKSAKKALCVEIGDFIDPSRRRTIAEKASKLPGMLDIINKLKLPYIKPDAVPALELAVDATHKISEAYKSTNPSDFVKEVLGLYHYKYPLSNSQESIMQLETWCSHVTRADYGGDVWLHGIWNDLHPELDEEKDAKPSITCSDVAKTVHDLLATSPKSRVAPQFPSYYGWKPPDNIQTILPTDEKWWKSQIQAWNRARTGDFAELIPHEPINVPIPSVELDNLRQKLRNATKKDKFADSGKFSIFPSWEGVTGTTNLTQKNACDLKVNISLQQYLNKAYKSKDPKAKELIEKTIQCRAPKMYEFVQIFRKPIKIESTGTVMQRNASVYLPIQFGKKDVYEMFKRGLALLLDLKIHEPKDKIPLIVNPGDGYIFSLSDSSDPTTIKDNKKILKAFFDLSNENTRNILILTLKHDQSTDAPGPNTIVRFQPFSFGRSAQIIGRAHRKGAQANYHKGPGDKLSTEPAILDSYELYYTPDSNAKARTRLSCDYLLKTLYNISMDAETELLNIMKSASFACSAMTFLHLQGLTYMPKTDTCDGRRVSGTIAEAHDSSIIYPSMIPSQMLPDQGPASGTLGMSATSSSVTGTKYQIDPPLQKDELPMPMTPTDLPMPMTPTELPMPMTPTEDYDEDDSIDDGTIPVESVNKMPSFDNLSPTDSTADTDTEIDDY